MSASLQTRIPTSPLTVGSVASLNQLACLQPSELAKQCDLLEIRLETMLGHQDLLQVELERFRDIPLLITARCAAEGGEADLTPDERASLLSAAAPFARWADIELASYGDMQDIAKDLRNQGIGLVLSYHNFEKTPYLSELQRIVDFGEDADIVKIAVRHHEVEDLTIGTQILQKNRRPMAFMGMGALAPVSRLLYAQHGSLLNYGYLGDEPTAPGQWPAELLKNGIAASEKIGA